MTGKSDAPRLFRPDAADIDRIAKDVAEISEIQERALEGHSDLHCRDRVAHQYQIAGGKVVLRIVADPPATLAGVGLFQPNAEYVGIGRISTGLGTPHIETNPDFLGARASFLTGDGHRVDFLAINSPGAPTDNHRDFVDVLHATGEAAGAEMPVFGDWGEYNVGNILAEQKDFAVALSKRMGVARAAKTIAHIIKQSSRTFRSSTAYQPYWTGIVEVNETLGKFTFVPSRDENHRPGFHPGERYLSEDWRKRQAAGEISFLLYWIAFLDEEKTPTGKLSETWQEEHKKLVGTITFPKVDPSSEDARLWAILASEMGAHPGNWVSNKANSIKEPSTEFGAARKLAYELSQRGRAALELSWYRTVFQTGQVGPELARELLRRHDEKQACGHVSWAP